MSRPKPSARKNHAGLFDALVDRILWKYRINPPLSEPTRCHAPNEALCQNRCFLLRLARSPPAARRAALASASR